DAAVGADADHSGEHRRGEDECAEGDDGRHVGQLDRRGGAGRTGPVDEVADEPGDAPGVVVDERLALEGAAHGARLAVDEGEHLARVEGAVVVGRAVVVRGHEYFVLQTTLPCNSICGRDAPCCGAPSRVPRISAGPAGQSRVMPDRVTPEKIT